METFAQAVSIAIPFFVGLMIIESVVARWKGIQINRPMDTISSLSSGLTFTLKQMLGLIVIILSYEWMVDRLAFFQLEFNWMTVVLAFIGLDFAGYWKHRWNHSFNLLWNRHIIHHSSEEFNLACALRQNISVVFELYFFLYLPMAIIGVPAKVVAIIAPIHFFAQFWYHTRLIDKMGWLEYIIVTPSHHRVHHAINKEYLDKNFAEIFIFWDKLFGTFQVELDEVPAVYGTKKPVKTWNPVLINFIHLWQLIKDAWRTKNWWDKIRIWFMPTGWRPNDVQEKYPISFIDKATEQVKYATSYSTGFLIFIVLQFVIANILQYYALVQISNIEPWIFILLCLVVFSLIFSYSSLMDGHKMSLIGELVKSIGVIVLILNIEMLPIISSFKMIVIVALISYSIASLFYTLYFLQTIRGSKQDLEVA